MTESIYKEFENKYYNPDDNDKRPGDNDNWKSIQKGFHDIGTTQLETSAGLTIGKGTEDEVSLSAQELLNIKNSGVFKIRDAQFIFSSADVSAIPGVSGKCQVARGTKKLVISDNTLTPNDVYRITYLNWMFDGNPSGVDVCSNSTGVVSGRVDENKQITWANPTIFLNTESINNTGAVVVSCLLWKKTGDE